MSKIGKKNIIVPKDSSIKIDGSNLTITGPKGSTKLTINDKIFSSKINESEFHEIMIYRSLHTLLNLMIPMWKITHGKGAIGLRGLQINLLKKLFPSKKFSHADDLVVFTNDIVQQKKEEYNWKYSPEIIII